MSAADPPTRLARKLGFVDAVVVGLGAMIGAGVFAAVAPAARAAGNGLLIGLLIAAVIAGCNATSSASLAALYPESGGTWVYARKRLSNFWGFIAGWAVLVYYAIANACALTLSAQERRWPRFVAVVGVVGCVAVAVSLPRASVIAGACVLLLGAAIHLLRRRLAPPPPTNEQP